MGKLGKPKGSRNKKTLVRVTDAAAPSSPSSSLSTANTITQPGHAESLNERVAANHEMQLFQSNVSAGSQTFESDTYTSITPLDGEFMSIDGVSTAISGEEPSLTLDSPCSAYAQLNEIPTQSSEHQGISETAHEVILCASRAFQPDDDRTCINIAELQDFVRPNCLGIHQKGQEQDAVGATATSDRESDGNLSSSRSTCCGTGCLKRLTDHLCHLNTIEHKQLEDHNMICMEITLAKTDTTLHFVNSVLDCQHCRIDFKVILLVMMVLQTALNWVALNFNTDNCGNLGQEKLPPVHFGTWKLPQSHAAAVKAVLTKRILSLSDSVASTLRLRVDEISLKTQNQMATHHQYNRYVRNHRIISSDPELLKQTLQRLTTLLRELAECVRHDLNPD